MPRALSVALVVLATATVVTAQTTPTTRLIPYSGTATDTAGARLSGTVSAIFELFEEQDGGAPLWQETQRVDADERGRYLVYLGSGTPLPQSAFTEERARWLAVTIDGRARPRVMLVAVPYALRAADADTLGGQPASSFVRSRADGRLAIGAGVVATAAVEGSGVPGQLAKFSSATTVSSSVISESATNRIGVGLPDPTGGGVVDSVFTIRNFDNNTGFAVLNQTQQRRFALNTGTNGGWTLYDGGAGIWNAGLRQTSGRIGIGAAPSAAHLVNVNQATTSGSGLVVQVTDGTSSWPAIQGITVGTGSAVRALSFFTVGTALELEVLNTSSNLIVGKDNNIHRFRVNGAGQVFATGYTTGGADFAEEMEPRGAPGDYEPGDVLAIGEDRDRTVVRTQVPYTTTVIGIYSTQPGITASPYSTDDPRREGKLPVAMIGIVPCKVSSENGPIARGDLLVSSSTPGHAMKATDRARMTGAIIGKALEALPHGKGKILVAVTLQ